VSVEQLPWHEAQWATLASLRAAGRLPHALLLRGPRGVGKRLFAERLTAWLLCAEETSEAPCGRCRGCRLRAAGSHPEARLVAPLEGKTTIGIDQIRELIGYVGLTRHLAPWKVIRIDPAEALTRSAANSLLKTLEEPPGAAVFLLVADQSTQLPATVRSRCQAIDLKTPPHPQARAWLAERIGAAHDPALLLELARGAPLAALELLREGRLDTRVAVFEDLVALAAGRSDPAQVAARWRKLGLGDVLSWVEAHAADLVRTKMLPAPARVLSLDLRESMQRAGEGLDLKQLFELLDRCTQARRALEAQLNLNEQLLLEDTAVAWRLAAADARE